MLLGSFQNRLRIIFFLLYFLFPVFHRSKAFGKITFTEFKSNEAAHMGENAALILV